MLITKTCHDGQTCDAIPSPPDTYFQNVFALTYESNVNSLHPDIHYIYCCKFCNVSCTTVGGFRE